MTSLKQQWYKANSYNLFQLINSVLAKSNQHWEKGKFYYHRLMENMYNLWYLCEVMIYIQELLLKSRMHIILSLCKNNVYNFVNIYIQEFKKKKIMIIAKWQRYMQLHFQPICFIRGWLIVCIHQNIFYQVINFFFKERMLKSKIIWKWNKETPTRREKERPESAKQKKLKQKKHPPLPNKPPPPPKKKKKTFNTKLLTFNLPKKNYL